jgi:hypothetical protein
VRGSRQTFDKTSGGKDRRGGISKQSNRYLQPVRGRSTRRHP